MGQENAGGEVSGERIVARLPSGTMKILKDIIKRYKCNRSEAVRYCVLFYDKCETIAPASIVAVKELCAKESFRPHPYAKKDGETCPTRTSDATSATSPTK